MRRLLQYFDELGVADQTTLRAWAERSFYKRDFEGRVRYQERGHTYGLGLAVFNWLVMRQRVPTVKPDVHLTRFFERAVGRPLVDRDVVALGTEVAKRLGIPAHELDWRIWESERLQL